MTSYVNRFRLVLLTVSVLVACAVNAAPAAPPALSPMFYPIQGVATIIEPGGQFYTNLGDKAQLYRGAMLRVVRDGQEIARAKVLKVDRLDSIAQLLPPYQGLLLEAGDTVQVVQNPVPATPRHRLPSNEPTLTRDDDLLVILLTLFAVGTAFH
ncbi:MAG TPA: hypothetical protein VGL77_07880 [Armatimonadota bacterium]|jgi:hypothetical protein